MAKPQTRSQQSKSASRAARRRVKAGVSIVAVLVVAGIIAWFAYQAASPLPGTLTTVRRLTQHPLFSIKNPNKVRALIGTFAVANPVGFNRPDGRGYEFVADWVLELDGFNPQVAARLLGAECIISGIRPQVAQTIVSLGIEFGDIATKATLADALAHALTRTGQKAGPA